MADTALAGWGELLPLLVFIILGWLANRSKQKQEQEAAGKPGQPRPQAPAPGGRPAPAHRDPGGQRPHTFEDGEDVEDWTGEDWDGEHSERWDDRRSGEVRTESPRPAEDRIERLRPAPPPPISRPPESQRHVPSDRAGAEKEPIIPAKAKEKAAEVGKDLLSQLAKELGIELPKPQPRPAPKPVPGPQPTAKPAASKTSRSGEGPAHAHVPRSHGISPDEVRARAAEESRSRSPAPHLPAAVVPPSKPLITAAEFSDPASLRKAFILKTILDKPVSLKPRGIKPD